MSSSGPWLPAQVQAPEIVHSKVAEHLPMGLWGISVFTRVHPFKNVLGQVDDDDGDAGGGDIVWPGHRQRLVGAAKEDGRNLKK